MARSTVAALLLAAGALSWGSCRRDEPVRTTCTRLQPSADTPRGASRYRCTAAVPVGERARSGFRLVLDQRGVERNEVTRVDLTCGSTRWSVPLFPSDDNPSEHAVCLPEDAGADCSPRATLVLRLRSQGPDVPTVRARVRSSPRCAWPAPPMPTPSELLGSSPEAPGAAARAQRLLEHDQLEISRFPSVDFDSSTPPDLQRFLHEDPTWRLYYLALSPVADIAEAYTRTRDERALQAGWRWVEAYTAQFPPGLASDDPEHDRFVWYDHGLALRLENLLRFARRTWPPPLPCRASTSRTSGRRPRAPRCA